MIQVGRYQVIRELAAGGMARVFLARATGPMGFEKTLVLKAILPHLTQDRQFVEMFLAEAKLAAQFSHPNLVQIFELGEVQGTYFIAMEYIDGPNLRSLVRRATLRSTKLPAGPCARIVWHACEGLAYAHEFCHPQTGAPAGLVHRDVSPENIIVSRNGTVKVVDFGIAKSTSENAEKTATGVVKGKLSYMAPEIIRGEVVDRRADVFALGITLYELLSGCRPFGPTQTDAQTIYSILYSPFVPITERRPDLPAELAAIVAKAMEKDRDKRYQDCRQMQADLEAYLSRCGESASPHQLARLVSELAEPTPAAPATPPTPLAPAPPSLVSPSLVVEISEGSILPAPQRVPTPLPVLPPPLPTPPPAAERRSRGQIAAAMLALSLLLVLSGAGAQSILQRVGHAAFERPGSAPAAAPGPTPAAPPAAAPTPSAVPSIESEPVAIRAYGSPEARPTETPDPVPPAPAPTPAIEEPEVRAPAVAPRRDPGESLATVVLEPSAGGRLRVEGRDAGAGPLRLKRRPGKLRVDLVSPSGAVLTSRVLALAPGDNGTKRIDLQEGTVEFRIRPYALVTMDGKPLGQTPLTVTAQEGPHRIVLANKELGREVELVHVVKPNQRTIVKYFFEE